MTDAAQKYNTSISIMRAPMELRLSMPAFHHPFTKSRHYNTSKMKCLREKHQVRTIEDLVKITNEVEPIPEIECSGRKPRGKSCKDKAQELLTRINEHWNPNQETPRRNNLWHTPRRIKGTRSLTRNLKRCSTTHTRDQNTVF